MNRRNKVDAVIVGLGWSGSIMAEELTRAGLNVVAIERGAWRDTATDFPPAVDTDELRWGTRRGMLQPPAVEALTFRNTPGERALPVRDYSAYQFGWNVGGAGTHWAGMTWRFNPWDFQVHSRTIERYGRGKIEDGLQLQDWGLTYDDLAPYYARFEALAGTSGTAGNIEGRIMPRGNPFEGPRSGEYPTPALKNTQLMDLFEKATKEMGYKPFPIPAGNISEAYTNPLGVRMGPCTYCGYCEFFGCGNWSKSSPQACILPALTKRDNFQIIANAEVLRVNKAPDGKTATGVTFVTSDGSQWEQPADIVVISAYQMDNVRLLLLSGIGTPYDHKTGKGVVGRNYSYQTMSGADAWFGNDRLNPYIGAGALGLQIDEFNADNFDHSDVDFIGGAGILVNSTNGRPIGLAGALPKGTPRWGAGWKEGFRDAYQTYSPIMGQGTSMPHRDVFLDLDPTYRDRHGQPLLRVTFDYNGNDRRMAQFISGKAADIARQAGATKVEMYSSAAGRNSPYEQRSSHTIGGAVIGDDPNTSALNRYLQSWDVHNVFVMGASAFPNNGGYNPTGTVGALALWSAHAIINDYVRSPAPLVTA